MKYYEMHEKVYRDLKEKGKLSWDSKDSYEEMWKHATNVYLHKFLSNPEFNILSFLDLGTGSGTAALYFAKLGANVVGIDISSSAIEMAKKNAESLDLSAIFAVGDITALELNQKFDVVIDSTLLHCLIGDDRKSFYDVAKRHLKTGGHIFINTMIADETVHSRFSDKYFVFQDNILWSLGIDEIGERKEIDGKSYFPHRTLLSLEEQFEEFSQHDLKVIKSEALDGCLVALLGL